jgi:hypothetical protein
MRRYPADGKCHYKIGRHRAGRHRWTGPAHRRPAPPVPLPRSGAVAAATAIACGLGVTGLAQASATGVGRHPAAVPAAASPSIVTSSLIRVMAQPAPATTPPTAPAPVGGLSRAQSANARLIVEVGREMGLPERAHVIAIACALQESWLRNLANESVAESFRYPHEGRGADHDSVGLFQQRPSAGWGRVRDIMRPAYAARRFYLALMKVPGWRRMSLTRAAQAVQNSAFPDAYARHEARAQHVVDAV